MHAKRWWIAVPVFVLSLLLGGPVLVWAGGLVGSTIFIFTDTTDSANQVHSDVAYNAQDREYLVVWWNDRPGLDDIYGQRVSRDGVLVDRWFATFANPGAEMRYPGVAYNIKRNEYLAVWEQDDGSRTNIHAQALSADGQRIGLEHTLGTGTALRNRTRPAVAYASTADRYLVVWQSQVQGGVASDVESQSLLSSGSPAAGSILIAQGSWQESHELPDVAYNRSRNEFLAVWQREDRTAGDYDIFGRRLTGQGTALGAVPQTISSGAGDDTAPAVAAIPTVPHQGQYLVVWESPYSPSVRAIYGRRLNGDGSQVGGIPSFSPFTGTATNPAVAGNEDSGEYLVAWNQVIQPPNPYSGARVRTMNLDGTFTSDPTWLWWFYSDHPAAASGPAGSFLTTFESIGVDWGIYGQLWGNRIYLPVVGRHFK
jgi:hypothetical protein